MKIFLANSLHLKIVLPILLLFSLSNLSAQVKFRLEPGVLLKTESENLGLLFNIEPNIDIAKNSVIGLRFGVSINSQKFEASNETPFFIDKQNDNAVISFVSTFDHYLNENRYRPYLGLGIGYYILSLVDVSTNIGSQNILEGAVKNQLGLLLRGGLEIGNTRFGLEYNFIPKADIELSNNQMVGKVNNSYFGLSVGFKLGGRKNQSSVRS